MYVVCRGKGNERSEFLDDFDVKYKPRFLSVTRKKFKKRRHSISHFIGAHLIFEENGEVALYKDLPFLKSWEPISAMNPIVNPMIVITEPEQAYIEVKKYYGNVMDYRRHVLESGISELENYCDC